METTAMILNYLINSETTLQSPLHPAGVGVQAALPLHIQVAFPQTAQARHLYCSLFFCVSSIPFLPLAPLFRSSPTFTAGQEGQVWGRSVPAEAAGLCQSVPCPVGSTPEGENESEAQKSSQLQGSLDPDKAGSTGLKTLAIHHSARTAFCKDQLSRGFIMCLLPLLESLWPDLDALSVLFQPE